MPKMNAERPVSFVDHEIEKGRSIIGFKVLANWTKLDGQSINRQILQHQGLSFRWQGKHEAFI